MARSTSTTATTAAASSGSAALRVHRRGRAGPSVAATVQKQASPLDLRLTRAAASALLLLLGLVLVAAGLVWLSRTPLFALKTVQLEGELRRSSVAGLRTQALPQVAGNFFSVDLKTVRSGFESTPWVRRAVARRVWPSQLMVHLEEHQPAALWLGGDNSAGPDRLVNVQGEVFEANASDVDDLDLPTLAGPEGQANTMLALYRRLQPLLAQLNEEVELLQLSDRGSWRAELRGGAVVELGRGSEADLLARTTQFVRTVNEATGRWKAPLEVVDLRHTDAYAVRLRGITVTAAANAASAPAKKN